MEEQEIISLIEGHRERLIREWQKALMDGDRELRNELHAQGAILQLIVLEINDRKESEHDTENRSTHFSTC